MDLKEGTLIDQEFLLEKKFESRAPGIVIAATQPRVRRRVVLRIAPAVDMGSLSRFARAKAIDSKYVAKFLELRHLDDGRPYFITEFVSGQSIDKSVAQAPLSISDAVDYLVQACEAVAAAHVAGSIHRRLKAASLLLSNDKTGTPSIKVIGFAQQYPSETSDLDLMPSPAYRAPEQFTRSRKVDGRADIWALGVILCEVLTRTNPFAEKTLPMTAKHIIEQPARRPSEHRKDIPPVLEQAILRCFEKSPDDRWRTANELGIALSAFGSARSQEIAGRLQHLLNMHPPQDVPPSSRQMSAASSSLADVTPVDIRASDAAPLSDDEIGFRRISEHGITTMSAEAVAGAARAHRVAAEARTLVSQSSSRNMALVAELAEEAERDNLRIIALSSPPPAMAAPAPVRPNQRKVLVIIVVAAVAVGLIVGVVVRMLDAR